MKGNKSPKDHSGSVGDLVIFPQFNCMDDLLVPTCLFSRLYLWLVKGLGPGPGEVDGGWVFFLSKLLELFLFLLGIIYQQMVNCCYWLVVRIHGIPL